MSKHNFTKVPLKLQQYIQDACLFDQPIDWYFVMLCVNDANKADKICCELINRLNLTVEKNGEEYRPNCLEAK